MREKLENTHFKVVITIDATKESRYEPKGCRKIARDVMTELVNYTNIVPYRDDFNGKLNVLVKNLNTEEEMTLWCTLEELRQEESV